MSRSNKCDNCGGSCEFDPSTQGLICKKCGALENFEESEVVKFHKFDMMTDIVEPEFSPQIHTLHCSNCGAIFKADTINISDNCQYCGASLTLDFTLSKASEPDGCIPFTFDEETAFNKFKDGIKRKWFLPNKFKKKLPKNSI